MQVIKENKQQLSEDGRKNNQSKENVHEPKSNQTDQESKAGTHIKGTTQEDTKEKKRVSFQDAEIVEFEPTVWTATVSSAGVPVSLYELFSFCYDMKNSLFTWYYVFCMYSWECLWKCDEERAEDLIRLKENE